MSDFVPAHETLGETNAANVVLVLHGVLGSRQNWRGLAKRLAGRRPDVCFVPVDLRCHGDSAGAPPPHSIAACAEDLGRLVQALSSEGVSGRLRALIGHSFGGKVGLEFSRLYPDALDQLWVLDSNPGPQQVDDANEVLSVLRAAEGVEMPVPSRRDIIQSFVDRGFSPGLANWMTTNVRRTDAGFVWIPDLAGIRLLLDDYFARDLWPVLEQEERATEIHFVVAERSDRVSPAMRQRIEALGPSQRTRSHVIAEAGHWLHVDNPEAVLELLERELVR
jgi:pimeloyl-ACP methyl ester carboxylesterase